MPNATQSTKTAAPSTSAAAPAASRAAGDADALKSPGQGATRGDNVFVAQDDILAALAEDSAQPNDDSAAAEAADELKITDTEADAADNADEADGDGNDSAPGDEADDTAGEAKTDETNADEAEATPAADETDPADNDKAKDPHRDGRNDRIDQLTAKTKELENQFAKAQERLAAFEARDAGRLEPDVLEHVDSLESLSDTQRRYSSLHAWALRHPDGGTLGQQEYDAEGVRDLLARTFELVHDAIPRRRDYLTARERVESEAVTAYPWLKEHGRGHGARVQQLITQAPQLRAVPNHRLILADAVVGEALRTAGVKVDETLIARLAKPAAAAAALKSAAAATARPRPPVKAPAMPGRAGVLPPRQTPAAAQARHALKRAQSDGGSIDSIADLIAANL